MLQSKNQRMLRNKEGSSVNPYIYLGRINRIDFEWYNKFELGGNSTCFNLCSQEADACVFLSLRLDCSTNQVSGQ